MPSIDWSQCPAVESIPGKVSGAWVFKDTRLPVATVIENLEDLSVDEVMEQFDVTREWGNWNTLSTWPRNSTSSPPTCSHPPPTAAKPSSGGKLHEPGGSLGGPFCVPAHA